MGRRDQALAALRAVGLTDPSEQAGTETMAKSPANRAKTRHSTEPKSPEGKDLAKPRRPTPKQVEAAKKFPSRLREKRPAPFLKVKGGCITIELLDEIADEINGPLRLMEALGTADVRFQDGLIQQLANVGSQGSEIDERGLNFMLSMVNGIEPKDQVEAMLAAQMAAVHMATMTFARRLAHVDNIPQQDSAERAFNKLARTFAAQVEALRRHRTGGEQKVTVEHVHVHEGGQAIVGNISHGGRSASKNRKSTP